MTERPLSPLQANGLLLLAAMIWGSAFVGQVWGMASVGPMSFTALRFALGALVVAPLAWREWRALRSAGLALGRQHLAWITLLGGLLCVGVLMQQIGLMSTSVTHAGFLTALYVPLVPLLAWLFQRQAAHWTIWVAVLFSLVGSFLLAGVGAWQGLSTGDAWIVASALPWSLHVLLIGRAAQRLRGAYLLACGQFAVCALLSAGGAVASERLSLLDLQQAAGAILYTGILSVGVGFTLQVIGQRHAPPAQAAIILSSEILFAALFGAWLMGDRLGSAGLLGGLLIVAGISLVQGPPLWRQLRWRRRATTARP